MMQHSPGDWTHLFGACLYSQKLIKMWSPRFWGLSPPHLNPLCLSICYLFVLLWKGWGARGKSSTPGRRGCELGGGVGVVVGLMDPSINGDSIHEMTQWKWRFLGMFYACVSIWLGLWQGGELYQWGSVERDQPGCYCMFCLVSHPCATEIESWDVSRSCIFLLCFGGSHQTITRKSGLLLIFCLLYSVEKLWWFALESNTGDALTMSFLLLIKYVSLYCLSFIM